MKNIQHIRLNEDYLKVIKSLALLYFDSNDVRIFGSRTDLSQKGGDIDVYIKTSKENDILNRKLAFLREFEKKFGRQKVDLIIEYKGAKEKKIYNEAKRKGIVI